MARYYQKNEGVYDVSKDKMLDQPEAERIRGLSTSALPQFIKNTDYDPNNSASKRYVPSGEQTAGVIQPPAPSQVAKTGASGVSTTPQGIQSVFGAGWQPADIFKQRGLLERGIKGAVRIKGGQDVFTIGDKGKWMETPEEYEELFGTREQAGIVGEITPEQAKLLGIRPEGVEELKAGRQKDKDMADLFKVAQKAGLSFDETMKLIESQYPTDTKSIMDELGIKDVADKLFTKPTKTQQEIYDQAYTDSGLTGIKDKIQDIDDQIKKARGDLGTATGQVNANPWISESSRVGKMRVLGERAEETIRNLENQRSQYMDVYNKGVDEIEGFMIRHNKQYEQEKELLAEQYNYLLDEAERRATEQRDKRYGEDLLRFMPSWLKGRAEDGDLSTMDLLNIKSKKLDIKKKLKDLEGGGEISSKTITQIDKISLSFDAAPIVKNFNDVQNKKLSIDNILSRKTGPSDLAAVFDFMKALDPTSVVRESEYRTAEASGNVLEGWAARFNKLFKPEGQGLPQRVRDEFSGIINEKFDAVRQQYANLRKEKGRLIDQKSGATDGLDYLIDYDFTKNVKTFQSIEDYVKQNPNMIDTVEKVLQEMPDLTDNELLEYLQSFSSVGGDTNKAITGKVGDKGGQCGRFVNKIAKLGIGDSYASKMAKMDKSIKTPKSGMVFLMPYKKTGHCGFIISIKDGIATVKDSNWSLDEKIKTHKIPVSKMTGFAYVNRLT